MANIKTTILETIGNTPLVRINKINAGKANIFAKVEYFNPAGSVKDRVALSMIEDAEAKGLLKQGSIIVEPTSGNTGIGLALVAAVKGYRLILTMPDSMSMERRNLLAAYGAELVLTPGAEGMAGAIKKANEIVDENPNSFMPQQFANSANPQIHAQTTAEEIWFDTDGNIDVFVAGVGTGGTVSGTAKGLKLHNPNIEVVAIEPDASRVLQGEEAGPHKIQGIGANFVPGNFDKTVVDKIISVTDDDAKATARAAITEGLLVGVSSGAALWAALKLSKVEEYAGKNIVVLLPDSGERYLSGWLFE